MKNKASLYIILICFPFNLISQGTFKSNWRPYNYETEITKPTQSKESYEIQYKHLLNKKDTINSIISGEIFHYSNRSVQFSYDDDGSLNTKEQIIHLNDSTILTTFEQIDESGIYYREIVKNYNKYSKIKTCQSKVYEKDTLLSTGKIQYSYNKSNQLVSIISFRNEKLLEKDTLIYDDLSKFIERRTFYYKDNIIKSKSLEYNENNEISSITTLVDSNIVKRTSFVYESDNKILVSIEKYGSKDSQTSNPYERQQITSTTRNGIETMKIEKYRYRELYYTVTYEYLLNKYPHSIKSNFTSTGNSNKIAFEYKVILPVDY